MYRILLLLLTSGLLTACVSPMRLGISEAEWQNYSPEQQQRIRHGYYEVLKKRFNDSEKNIPDGSNLHVTISGGQVRMPPFDGLRDYTPTEFDILSGHCQSIRIDEANGAKQVDMQVCYRNKSLYLDPSRYDPARRVGSIQLHYSPIWDRGFIYQNVSSSGYVHLTSVNVAVRRYQNDEPADSAN